jgi:hypothetical protein
MSALSIHRSIHCGWVRSLPLRAAGTLFLWLGMFGLAAAQEAQTSREDQFKAAYLFNFLKFVEWPAAVPADVLKVCFAGGGGVYDSFAVDLDAKRVGARRIVVHRLQPGESASTCNALYVDASVARESRIVEISELPVLTVSDARAFANNVGIIELFADNNRLRFNINLRHAQRVGLRISSNLLQLAAVITRDGA